jgi:hypothetical protein
MNSQEDLPLGCFHVYKIVGMVDQSEAGVSFEERHKSPPRDLYVWEKPSQMPTKIDFISQMIVSN